MHTVHAGFSFVCPLKPEAMAAARGVLLRMRANVDQVFARAPSTHFLSGVVLPVQHRGKKELPATLLFLTSFWGPTRVHLDELVAAAGADLRELFSYCRDAPDPECSDADLAWYMERHRKPDTFYSGMHHVTHQDVLDEKKLRVAIEDHVDRNAAVFARLKDRPLEARARIQEFVRSRPDLEPATRPWNKTLTDMLVMHRHVIGLGVVLSLIGFATLGWWTTRSTALGVAAGTGGLALGAFLVLALLLLGLTLVYERKLDRFVAPRQPDDRVKAIHRTQLNPVINEMTVGGPIKEGWGRPTLLRIALWIVARYVTTARITIPTVAAARWLAIDGGQRLVFVSNFTNMSEGYVRDFIDIKDGAARINLLFGWGHGYPTTRALVYGGAQDDSNGFIHVVNMQQHLTELWYCPYKDLSIDNINRNRQLRLGLSGDVNEWQAQQWLRLL